MEFINNFINNTQVLTWIVLGLCLVVIILIILISVLFRDLGSVENKYNRFMRGSDNENIEKLIVEYLDKVDKSKDEADEAKEICKDLNSRLEYCIQKMAVIRYRAFEDVGSDLSFSIALLDGNNNGVILTGIYGRNESATYAKPIDKGISRYELSMEEKQVLYDAMGKSDFME